MATTLIPPDTAPRVRAGRRRVRRFALVLGVVLGVLAVSGVLAGVTLAQYHHNEFRLLALQTRLTAAAGSIDSLYVDDHLASAAILAAATGGSVPDFERAVADSLSAGSGFDEVSLWRAGSGPVQQLAQVGASPVLAPASSRAAALISEAAVSKTFLVATVSAGHVRRIAYAAGASGPGGRYVAYAEEVLPANRRITEPASSPIADLNIAVYLGRKRSRAALLETNSPVLPLSGTTYTAEIPLGATVLTVTTSPREPLAGTVSRLLPWLILAGGAVLAVLAGMVTERLVRRRQAAERLSDEIGSMYAEQRSVAQTLQQALLPEQTPVIPGVQVAVCYLPGASGVDIGGDWYDAIAIDDQRFMFVIGDVSGRGVRAATAMAALHFASRAYALEGHAPAALLGLLARTLDITRDGHFATVLCGLADTSTRQVILASAGHLPPVVCSPGDARLVPVPAGPPVGVTDSAHYEEATVTIRAGETFLACTDGLVERRGELIDTGLARLQKAAMSDHPSVAALLDSVVAELTADSPVDDIAMIGFRWTT